MEEKIVDVKSSYPEVMEEMEAVAIPETLSEEQFALLAQNALSQMGEFGRQAMEDGTADSPLKTGKQKLEMEDVLMKMVRIDNVNISRAVDDKTGEISDYPILALREYPYHFCPAGTRMMDMVISWARHAGDAFTAEKDGNGKWHFTGNRLLPKLNQALAEKGGPTVVFHWVQGKSNKYIEPTILAG